jgi:hypothetical protein
MPIYAGVDSNTLTYLLEALQEGYDPSLDTTGLAAERVAMVRCFFYGDCSFWVTPTAQEEYTRIKNAGWRQTHDRWTKYLLQDMPLKTTIDVLNTRTAELRVYHKNENDCRVVAETEFAKLETLLSCDAGLRTHLQNHTPVKILKPTELWGLLGIAPTATPVVEPRWDNPLAQLNWWRLEPVGA